MSGERTQATCALCGKPIENPLRALPEVTAWERIDGTGSPELIEYTGRLAHGACVAREELQRPPQDTSE